MDNYKLWYMHMWRSLCSLCRQWQRRWWRYWLVPEIIDLDEYEIVIYTKLFHRLDQTAKWPKPIWCQFGTATNYSKSVWYKIRIGSQQLSEGTHLCALWAAQARLLSWALIVWNIIVFILSVYYGILHTMSVTFTTMFIGIACLRDISNSCWDEENCSTDINGDLLR